jgi:putative membrane protein
LREGPLDGEEPDPRFSLANERTFLAWIRTSIALIAGGVASAHLLTGVSGADWALGVPLAVLGLGVAATSYRHHQKIQLAMRHDEPLPNSPLPAILAVGVSAVGLSALVLTLVDAL